MAKYTRNRYDESRNRTNNFNREKQQALRNREAGYELSAQEQQAANRNIAQRAETLRKAEANRGEAQRMRQEAEMQSQRYYQEGTRKTGKHTAAGEVLGTIASTSKTLGASLSKKGIMDADSIIQVMNSKEFINSAKKNKSLVKTYSKLIEAVTDGNVAMTKASAKALNTMNKTILKTVDKMIMTGQMGEISYESEKAVSDIANAAAKASSTAETQKQAAAVAAGKVAGPAGMSPVSRGQSNGSTDDMLNMLNI